MSKAESKRFAPALASFFRVLLLCCLGGAGALSPEALAAEKGERRLLIVAPPAEDAGAREFSKALTSQVIVGVRMGLAQASSGGSAEPSQAPKRFTDLFVAGQLASDRANIAARLREYENYSANNQTAALQKIETRYGKARATGFLDVNVLRVDAETVVQLILYEIPERQSKGSEVLPVRAFKSIAAPSDQMQSLLERVGAAACSIASPEPDLHEPEVVVRLAPAAFVEPGTLLTLDGSGARDPDQDGLSWEWHQWVGADNPTSSKTCTGGCRLVPGGSRITVSDHHEGVHHYRLLVREVADVQRSAASNWIRVEFGRFNVDAGEGGLRRPGEAVELDGSRTRPKISSGGDVEAHWEQLEGPPVPIDAPRSEQARFTPALTGVYKFRLSVSAGGRSGSHEVSYLVAQPPRALPGPRALEARPNVPLRLDWHGTHDEIDASPAFFWTITRGAEHSNLSDPRSSSPDFVAREPGTYRLRLRVRARRDFNGHQFVDTDERELTVRVMRSPWLILLEQATTPGKTPRMATRLGVEAFVSRYFFDWPTALGIRFDQTLVTTRLGGEIDFIDRIEAGGGTLVAATTELELGSIGALIAHLGYRSRLSAPTVDFGLRPSFHLFEHLTARLVLDLQLKTSNLSPALWGGFGLSWRP